MLRLLGVVESIYCEWENGKLFILTKIIYQLGNFFEVDIDYMMVFQTKEHILKRIMK